MRRSLLLLLLLLLFLALVPGCGEEEEECTPACEDKQCGVDDRCGVECGQCTDQQACLAGECIACDRDANCLGHACGPDGCGGTCGPCTGSQVCDPVSYLCVEPPVGCQPACEESGWDCGPDGCGGECGACAEGTFCKADKSNGHLCLGKCIPACEGKECGDDGCGGECGVCGEDEVCEDSLCLLTSLLPDDDFVALFGYQGRIPGVNNEEHDLFLVNPDRSNPVKPEQPGPQPLTGFSITEATDNCQLILAEDENGNPTEYAPCSCNFGCVVDRSLNWMAVSVKKPTENGFTFQIGRFDDSLHVAMVKGIFMKDIVDFKFAANYLYYSRKDVCEGLKCQYKIFRRQLDPVGLEEELFVFPPQGDPDWPKHSNYTGHFKVSNDGSMLVLLGTTIRSVRIYMWKQGILHEVDYICNHIVNQDCIGAGSEYTDTDPIAISPDNSKIIFFAISETHLKARVYDTATLQKKELPLMSVPTGTYLAEVCKYINKGVDWQFEKVTGDPKFSPDGKSVYFITRNECSDVIAAYKKPHTNILMMDLAIVGDGSPFEESDFVNVTRNPLNDQPENTVVESFDISPSGKTLLFAGTPIYKFEGDPADPYLEPLGPDHERTFKDKEIWVVGSAGQGKTQVTDSKTFMAQSPMSLARTALHNYANQ
jgi:hypothetical protein